MRPAMASSLHPQEGAEGARRGLLLGGGLKAGDTEGPRLLALDGTGAGRIILLRDNALTTRPRMETTLAAAPPPPPLLIRGLLTAERGAIIVSAVSAFSAEFGGEAAARLSLRLLVRPLGRLSAQEADGAEEGDYQQGG